MKGPERLLADPERAAKGDLGFGVAALVLENDPESAACKVEVSKALRVCTEMIEAGPGDLLCPLGVSDGSLRI